MAIFPIIRLRGFFRPVREFAISLCSPVCASLFHCPYRTALVKRDHLVVVLLTIPQLLKGILWADLLCSNILDPTIIFISHYNVIDLGEHSFIRTKLNLIQFIFFVNLCCFGISTNGRSFILLCCLRRVLFYFTIRENSK